MLVLGLILGLLAGFWAKDIYVTLHSIYANQKDQKEYNKAGVVRPGVTRGVTPQPINLESRTGGVRRPTPEQAKIANMEAREERLRNS